MKIKFIEKTLSETAEFFKWEFFAEKYASKNGLFQKISSDKKLVILILIAISINLCNSLVVLAITYLILLMLVLISKINPGFFIKKILVIIPLVLGIILLPSTLNIVINGSPLLHITKYIFFTREGVYLASVIIMRTLITVSFVVLINLTTPWNQILNSLSVFKIPDIVIQILNMSYRYLYILIKTIEEFHYALKSRILTKLKISNSRKLISFQIASLFRKSLSLTDLTYKAMVSRGYTAKY